MYKLISDENIKVRSDFIGAIDKDFLAKKVLNASLRMHWLHIFS